jgi:septal ring factor EnvC (AmiA/AmiB activator)
VCGNEISRTTSLLIAPSSKIKKEDMNPKGLERKKQTPFVCGRCGTRFPVSVNRKRYAVVPVSQLRELHSKLDRSQSEGTRLSGKIANLGEEKKEMKDLLKVTKEESDIRQLESKLSSLESHVSHLKRDKEELEQKITEMSARE